MYGPYKVTIDYTNLDADEWIEIAYGSRSEFNEDFVIYGNPNFASYKEASWFKKITELIGEYENETEREAYPDFDEDTWARLDWVYHKYGNSRYGFTDDEAIVKMLNALYPEREFMSLQLNGYYQGEWTYCICEMKHNNTEFLMYLRDWYFGYIKKISITVDGERMIQYEPITRLFNLQISNKLKDYIRECFDLDSERDIIIDEKY